MAGNMCLPQSPLGGTIPMYQKAEDKRAGPERKLHHLPAETWAPRKNVTFSSLSLHYPF